ncbi:hypothetical protein K438DRAFT_1769701 [Mycena galopus ATCC 62051]|nr:hypothetical protein K438DRAFT_1769701 [Mycena galopus ATCC 62051]
MWLNFGADFCSFHFPSSTVWLECTLFHFNIHLNDNMVRIIFESIHSFDFFSSLLNHACRFLRSLARQLRLNLEGAVKLSLSSIDSRLIRSIQAGADSDRPNPPFFCNLIFTWTFSIVADFARSRVRVSLEWRAGLKSRGDLEDEIFYFRCGL